MATSYPIKGDADKKIGAYSAPLSVSAQDTPNMTVKIRAGSYFNGLNTFVEFTGGSSPTITAPIGNPKWVVVALQNSGLITVVDGTPAAAPSLPAVPSGLLPIAAVFVTPTTTAITPALIADVRPFLRTVDTVADLTAELADRPTSTDLANALALKADVDGTPSPTFGLNADFTVGVPTENVSLTVSRGASPEVSIRWNETTDLWELTNDGVTFSAIASSVGTFAPIVHTHVAADITNFTSATNALIALATIAQSQVTNLVSDLAAKAPLTSFNTHVGNAAIHFSLPITQGDVTGLTSALNSKLSSVGGTATGDVTVEGAGFQPITLTSTDASNSGLKVDRSAVPGPNALFTWDESLDAWLIGTVGSMNTVLTSVAISGKVDTTTQVIAGNGLSGGGALSGNVTLSMPNVGTAVANQARKITTDAQGRVSATSALVPADISAADAVHTHVVADITDFAAEVSSAVAGEVGVTIQGLDTDLSALAALATTGLVARTGAGTYLTRTIAGTALNISVTNGDGVAGSPVLDLIDAGTPVTTSFVKITTDAKGRVTGTTPVGAGDITTLVDATYLNVAGDTMTGALSMGGNAINTVVQINGNPGNSMTIAAGTAGGGSGNALFLRGGAATNGTGGDVTISGRDGVGTDQNGGVVFINAGSGTGAGQGGFVEIDVQAGQVFKATAAGNVALGLPTDPIAATNGFPYIPFTTTTGAPSGVPTAVAGFAPMIAQNDAGAFKLWVYIPTVGWKSTTLA